MIKAIILLLILLDVFLVLYSCQSRQPDNLASGIIPFEKITSIPEIDMPVLVTDASSGDIISGIGALGSYYAVIDTRKMSGELIPLRKGQSLGDVFTVDITGYLNGNPCGNCFKLDSIELSSRNEILAEFSMRHPFPLPAHNPPEYRERLDLHVFDVRAIFFFKDENAKTISFDGIKNAVLGPLGGVDKLDTDNSGFWASEDWDGATWFFDDYVDSFWQTDSDIHPYRIFFEDASHGNVTPDAATGFADPYHPSGHNVFPQGGGPDAKTINLGNNPNQELGFIIVIAAAYGQSARFWGSNSGQRGSPRYYLPEFNCKEPWKVKPDIPSDTNLLSAGDSLSSMVLNIDVWDWQHSYGNVLGDYDPHSAPLDSLRKSSKVKGVYVEIPGVSNIDSVATPISGVGLGSDPLRYSITINNDMAAQKGEYLGLVAVTDELHGTNLEGYGVKRDGVTLFDVNSFVTYAVFKADVIDRGGSFGVGMNVTNPDSGAGDYSGLGVKLDSISADNILVDGNMVHVVASILEGPGGNGWDIYYFRSTNHGLSFETPVMLSNDWESGSYSDQVEPSIAMAPDTGRIYFVFTDKSHLRQNVANDAVFFRYSNDDGLNFSKPATRISMVDVPCDQPSVAAGINGFVWVVYRQIQNSYDKGITVKTSYDYGHSFFLANYMHNAPYNYETPMLLTQLSPGNYYVVGLIWRQESYNYPDLKFALSHDAGGFFNAPINVSFEKYYEFASMPRAGCDSNGNIFLAYKVNKMYEMTNKVLVTYGQRNTFEYIFEDIGQINMANTLIGDLDIFVSNLDHVFLSWNQDDPGDASIEHDIMIYRSLGSPNNTTFDFLCQLPESSANICNQEMPRLGGNEQNEIFLAYRDNSIVPGGDVFLTMGMDE